MIRYSIWLMPSGGADALLAAAIAELSRTYDGPSFEPHVTLLGDLLGSEEDVATRTLQLAQRLRPYEVQLSTPAYLDQYFRCVFLRVRETPLVMEANAQAIRIFDREDDPPYMPHLSLLYGFFPAALKEQIIAGLSPDLSVRFEATQIHLIGALSDDPKDWSRILEAPLK